MHSTSGAGPRWLLLTTLMMTRKYVTRPNRMVDMKVPAGIACFHVRVVSGFAELPLLNTYNNSSVKFGRLDMEKFPEGVALRQDLHWVGSHRPQQRERWFQSS